jgi:hypothetical protein
MIYCASIVVSVPIYNVTALLIKKIQLGRNMVIIFMKSYRVEILETTQAWMTKQNVKTHQDRLTVILLQTTRIQ